MDISFKSLVVEKYYILFNYQDSKIIFKYKGYGNLKIKTDNFYIHLMLKDEIVKFYESNRFHFDPWYNDDKIFKECLFEDLVYYLPNKHPDRINYFRRRKLDYLLNLKYL